VISTLADEKFGNLNALLSLCTIHPDPHVLLPLFRILSRLVSLPSHREALASWAPANPTHMPTIRFEDDWSRPGPSALKLSDESGNPLRTSSNTLASLPAVPFVLDYLLRTITLSSPAYADRSSTLNCRLNPKLLEASLDLLAALVKGQPRLAAAVRSWSLEPRDEIPYDSATDDLDEQERSSSPQFVGLSVDMLLTGPTAVRIAVASW